MHTRSNNVEIKGVPNEGGEIKIVQNVCGAVVEQTIRMIGHQGRTWASEIQDWFLSMRGLQYLWINCWVAQYERE